MTSLFTTRRTPDGMAYQVVLPTKGATDGEFASMFARLAREFLHREGVAAHHLTDEEICQRVRNTFGSARHPLTGVVQSP